MSKRSTSQRVSSNGVLHIRCGDADLYLGQVLEAQHVRLNPGVVDSTRASDIIRQLNVLTWWTIAFM